MNDITWLEEWYQDNCNGQWEHFYGIEIKTLDNPGWHVKISLNQTKYNEFKSKELFEDLGADNWIKCSIADETFNGYGDSKKLDKIIQTFRIWIESHGDGSSVSP